MSNKSVTKLIKTKMKTLEINIEALQATKNILQLNVKECAILDLIAQTTLVGGCSIVSLKNYCSDKSGNTELANQSVNIGASYANMKAKGEKTYKEVDLSDVETMLGLLNMVESHNYSKYVINDLPTFKKEIVAMFAVALEELKTPSTKETNDIWINKALCFNTNTKRLSIFGQSLSKTVVEKGEFKQTKSAPKTVAKNIINEYCKPTKSLLRRFAVDNFINGEVKILGEVIEIG